MTLYLTDNTSVGEIKLASESNIIFGAKLYPVGATTNSDAGVSDISKLTAVFDMMQEQGLVLQIHGEEAGSTVDIFDREKLFIDKQLVKIRRDFPELRIVFEHITTKEAVDFVRETKTNIAATITAHHLLINRNAMFKSGIRPHNYCLPVAKREFHREALVEAATSGQSQFFAGTDSAPHSQDAKESACGCAGIYSAFNAVELYAETFDLPAQVSRFEAFMSFNGADFYQIPRNSGNLCLERKSWRVPDNLDYPDSKLIPFMAGETLQWKTKTDV